MITANFKHKFVSFSTFMNNASENSLLAKTLIFQLMKLIYYDAQRTITYFFIESVTISVPQRNKVKSKSYDFHVIAILYESICASSQNNTFVILLQALLSRFIRVIKGNVNLYLRYPNVKSM